MTAITNEEDFAEDKNEFLKEIIQILVSDPPLLEIGAYTRLANDLFLREY